MNEMALTGRPTLMEGFSGFSCCAESSVGKGSAPTPAREAVTHASSAQSSGSSSSPSCPSNGRPCAYPFIPADPVLRAVTGTLSLTEYIPPIPRRQAGTKYSCECPRLVDDPQKTIKGTFLGFAELCRLRVQDRGSSAGSEWNRSAGGPVKATSGLWDRRLWREGRAKGVGP